MYTSLDKGISGFDGSLFELKIILNRIFREGDNKIATAWIIGIK